MYITILTNTVVRYVCIVHSLPQLWRCVITSRHTFVYTSLYSKCKMTHWDSVFFYVASMSVSIFDRLICGLIFKLGYKTCNTQCLKISLIMQWLHELYGCSCIAFPPYFINRVKRAYASGNWVFLLKFPSNDKRSLIFCILFHYSSRINFKW